MSYSRGKMTIDDIAQALGISKTTVSRSISGKGRISEDTRKKVIDYIKAHDYTPNRLPEGLHKPRRIISDGLFRETLICHLFLFFSLP